MLQLRHRALPIGIAAAVGFADGWVHQASWHAGHNGIKDRRLYVDAVALGAGLFGGGRFLPEAEAEALAISGAFLASSQVIGKGIYNAFVAKKA